MLKQFTAIDEVNFYFSKTSSWQSGLLNATI